MSAQAQSASSVKSLRSFKQTLRLFKFAKNYWPAFSVGILLLIISSVTGLIVPKLLGDLINAGGRGNLKQSINQTGLLLLVVLAAQSIVTFFRVIAFSNVTEKTLAALRQTVYNHLIQLPVKFFVSRRVGELSSRMSADIALLQETFNTTLTEFIRQVITILGGIALLLLTSASLTAFMLSILPVMMLIALFAGHFIRKHSKNIQEKIASSNVIVEETLQGIISVKSFAGEFFEMKRYRKFTDEAALLGIKVSRYRGAFSSFIVLGIYGALVAVIWRGAIIGLDTGALFSFLLYAMLVGNSITGLADLYTGLQKSIGAADHLLEILDEPIEPLSHLANILPENQLHGQINFKQISFYYPSRENINVLHDMSFTVKANEKVAIVGPSGAGKSTIVSLLLRIYDPVNGHIVFDGRDSQAIPLSAIRTQIAVVPQDVFLFGGSIAENIAYGREGATEAEIIAAAKQANAWEFIDSFPLGLETIVGERGIQLSGGQRQRIAIARAVLKAPRILILDEATSSLDTESEKLVQDALDKLMEGRTSIVIAHRLSTIRKADRIIVLNKGTKVEEGTHKELINIDGGLYRNLNEIQFS